VIRRVVYAATLLALPPTALIACDNDDNTDVQGGCASDLGVPPDCMNNCACGTGGHCVQQKSGTGQCLPCDCDSDEWCDPNGACHAYSSPSSGACYGAPPLMAPCSMS
jgi:hypothetical protein